MRAAAEARTSRGLRVQNTQRTAIQMRRLPPSVAHCLRKFAEVTRPSRPGCSGPASLPQPVGSSALSGARTRAGPTALEMDTHQPREARESPGC